MTIRVGVFGAGGRMGAAVCRAVADDPALELAAAVDPHHAGIDLRQVTRMESPDLQVASNAEELLRCGVEVAVDFTVAGAARQNLELLADNGIHAVVGTTGLDDDDIRRLHRAFVRSNCLIAPNFSIGAVLMARFAAIAAPFFQVAEIVECQDNETAFAPSSMSIDIAQRMADSGWKAAPESAFPTDTPGAGGALGPGDIPLHSVRLHGVGSRHELILGTTGQQLMIRHESHDHSMFMPGVILAIKKVASITGVTVGLDALLDL
jgi:4-hydroxy-tetrahydrodipicolinate reductase